MPLPTLICGPGEGIPGWKWKALRQFSPRLQYGSNVIFKVKVADSSLRKQMHSC